MHLGRPSAWQHRLLPSKFMMLMAEYETVANTIIKTHFFSLTYIHILEENV